MTPDECRAARNNLNITRHELSLEAGVPLWFIEALEDGAEDSVHIAGFENELREALKSVPVDILLASIGLESPSASVMSGDAANDTQQNPAT